MNISENTLRFVVENATANVRQLAFKSARYPDVDMPFALRQIAGLQSVKNKIPSFFNAGNLIFPPKISLEQTSSEATALYKASLCRGKRFVDLTGGFGCDSYFISRYFDEAVFVEQNAELCEMARHNFKALNAVNIQVFCSQAEDYLTGIEVETDVIYLDPARRSNTGSKTVLIADCMPDVAQLSDQLVAKSKKVLIKLSPLIDISATLKELKYVTEVHIVAVENECKEALFVLSTEKIKPVSIVAVNIMKNSEYQLFSFIQEEEGRVEVKFAETIGNYLYEPNSAILKAGAFRNIAHKFNLHKMDINTHLYTSENYVEDFPGRIFSTVEIIPFSKPQIKILKLKYPKANITVRNFPLSVNEIRAKTGITEGGDVYVFAAKFKTDNLLIVCRKV